MNQCPWCNASNIAGADHCEECGQPLEDPHLTEYATGTASQLLLDRVAILEPRPAITLKPSGTLDEALKLLADHRIGCVLVVDKGKLVGIFSERDALYRVGADVETLRQRPVSEFMTPNVQTLDVNAKVAYAVRLMDLGHYRHVPIVSEDGSLAGIISVRDILGYLTDRMSANCS